MTADPPQRLAQHINDAAPFGVGLVAAWISHAHDGCAATERLAVGIAARALRGRRIRREYFRGASFDGMVELGRQACTAPGRGELIVVLRAGAAAVS